MTTRSPYVGCMTPAEFERAVARHPTALTPALVLALRRAMVYGETFSQAAGEGTNSYTRQHVHRVARTLYERFVPEGWEVRPVCLPAEHMRQVEQMIEHARHEWATRRDREADHERH